MQMSIRPYLTAGTVAVVGAATIAFVPPPPVNVLSGPDISLQTTAAQVALTADGAPWADILAALTPIVTNLLPSVSDYLSTSVTDFISGLISNGAALVPALTGLLPTSFIDEVSAEVFAGVGPLVLGAAQDVLGYLGTTAAGLVIGPNSIPVVIVGAVSTIPGALLGAVEALFSGRLAEAFGAITTALSAPARAVETLLAEVSQSFQNFVVTEAADLLGQIPELILSAVETAIGRNVQVLTTAVADLLGVLLPGLTLPTPAAVPAKRVAAAAAIARPVAPVAAVMSVGQGARVGEVASAGEVSSVGEAPEGAPEAPSATEASDGSLDAPETSTTVAPRSRQASSSRTPAGLTANSVDQSNNSGPRSRGALRHADKSAPAAGDSDAGGVRRAK